MKYKTKNMNLQLFAGENIITDLTGTTWELNSVLYTDLEPIYTQFYAYDTTAYSEDGREFFEINPTGVNAGYLNFKSNNEDFIGLLSSDYSPLDGGNSAYVYDYNSGWYNQAYRTITITGGTDATNQDLISWLQANATQIQTGYSSTISLTNCTCNKSSETGLSGSYEAIFTANDGYYFADNSITCSDSNATITYITKNSVTVNITSLSEDFTITATASAITIKNVLLHPDNNGITDFGVNLYPDANSATSLEVNRLFRISYTITPTVIFGTYSGDEYIWTEETASVTIIPNTNYQLPSSITVSGASYTYDSTTGVVTLSNPVGNVTITCACDIVVS